MASGLWLVNKRVKLKMSCRNKFVRDIEKTI